MHDIVPHIPCREKFYIGILTLPPSPPDQSLFVQKLPLDVSYLVISSFPSPRHNSRVNAWDISHLSYWLTFCMWLTLWAVSASDYCSYQYSVCNEKMCNKTNMYIFQDNHQITRIILTMHQMYICPVKTRWKPAVICTRMLLRCHSSDIVLECSCVLYVYCFGFFFWNRLTAFWLAK